MYRSQQIVPLPHAAYSPAAVRILDRIVRSAVPLLADFCLVHVVSGRSIVGVAATHVQAEKRRTLRELMRAHRLSVTDTDSAVAYVIRTGRPLIRSEIYRDPPPGAMPLRTARTPRQERVAELHRRLAPRSALVVPVVVRGVVLGALSLCYSTSRRRYAASELAPARRLALQIGYVLMMTQTHGDVRLPAAAGRARQVTPHRRRVAPRN